jgi:hypothetical protein
MIEINMVSTSSEAFSLYESRDGPIGDFELHTRCIGSKLMKKRGYDSQGIYKRGQGTNDPIMVEPMMKHEGLGFYGGEYDMGECSKVIQGSKHIRENECFPHLKRILSPRGDKTNEISFLKVRAFEGMESLEEENTTINGLCNI